MGSELGIDRRGGMMCIILALRGAWVLRQRYIYFSTLRACMVFVVVNTISHSLANLPPGPFIPSLSDTFSRNVAASLPDSNTTISADLHVFRSAPIKMTGFQLRSILQ